VRLTLDGHADLDVRDVCESVAATPYRLWGWMQTRALTTDAGVPFERRSGTPGAPPLTTLVARGTPPWTRGEAAKDSRKDSPKGEICQGRLPSDPENDEIQGAAWMDDAARTPRAKSSVNP